MNIETTNLNTNSTHQVQNKVSNTSKNSTKFSDELKDLKTKEVQGNKEQESSTDNENIDNAIDDLNTVVKELNQSEENTSDSVQKDKNFADNKLKGENLINRDFNIQEQSDLLPQMNPNMNFAGNGQPFSSFMNNSSQEKDKLSSSAKDLAEEAAILSTMAENIALANKNSHNIDTENKGSQVNTKQNLLNDNIVKFDSIIMNKADIEVFTQLVEKGSIDSNNLNTESIGRSLQISKTLADMLAKAKDSNQPLRIDFDNNISVIIKISREGKISADFLPSSQVAEAYLKENLPLLKQRFDEKNIEYDELNHRERKDQNKEQNQKKGRNNE